MHDLQTEIYTILVLLNGYDNGVSRIAILLFAIAMVEVKTKSYSFFLKIQERKKKSFPNLI